MHKTNRREFMKTVGLGTAALTLPGMAPKPEIDGKRPNVLFLFTDDQRFDTVQAVNCPEIETPNLDKLVKRGVTFTHAHIMGGTSGAVCMPSRAMLMTGRTLFHLENRGATIPVDHTMMPEVFRDAGYSTFASGKWHNGYRAFARAFTHGGKIMFGGMSDHRRVPVYDFDPTGAYPPEACKWGERFSSELFTDDAVRFLGSDAAKEPFFAYVSYTAPHDPRTPPKEFAERYPAKDMSLPPNFLTEHPFDNGEMKIRDERLAPMPRDPDTVRKHRADYYGMISHVDQQVGRLLDALEKNGLADDTIIVFTSDNGLAVGSHGLLGKQNLYEHSVRVPLIMSGPGIPQGVQTHGLCYLLDLFPTLCALTGLKTPDSVEGRSLAPLLADPNAVVRNALFLAYTKLHRGLRTRDDWKLIQYNVQGTQTTQLFDLNDDPHELTNRADDPDCADRLTALNAMLQNRMKELDDFCRLDEPNWGLPLEITKKRTVKHLAVGRKITLEKPCSPRYTGGGPNALIDGTRATTNHTDGSWQGFEGEDLTAMIDLGRILPLNMISAGFLKNHGSWIFLPLFVTFAISENGSDFREVKRIAIGKPAASHNDAAIRDFHADFEETPARFVRVHAKNMGTCPDWHQGVGGKSWIFADEITVK